MSKKAFNPETIAVRSGLCSDKNHDALVPPVYLSTTYTLKGLDQKGDYDYSRTSNPTRDLLANCLADLEEGTKGIITSTGMSACLLVCHLLTHDDLLVIPHDCYGGSYRLFLNLAKKGAFQLEIIDQNDSSELARVLAKKPKLIWLESPSNPLMRLVDIQKISDQAKKTNTLVAVDNTFLSPLLQKPLLLGADIVVHSTTKFINGHSDVVSGAVITKDPLIGDELKWWANCIGITGSAQDSYMVLRGIRSLAARIRIHQENTKQIINFLQNHNKIRKIYYPGVSTHPQHELAKTQQLGFGSMLSFELNEDLINLETFLSKLQIFTLAQSLGGVESLINHPSSMTHASMSDEAKKVAGVSNSLLRLSVGIEYDQDLIDDLKQALS